MRKAVPFYNTFSNLSTKRFCTKVKAEAPDIQKWPRRVLSGVQPTGSLHVGNYFGAIKPCVALQNKGEDLTLFIADLHALTTVKHDSKNMPAHILETTAALLASGIDPERCILFLQSSVPRHAELCWILTCLATEARLAHLPQYKEKSSDPNEVGMGLMLYPVLQAADILLYRATHVPVGADQVQHFQIAAQLVKTFHHRYGKAFPTPQAIIKDDGSDRIKSLRDPSKKMSKSDPNLKSRILLTDSDEEIKMKIRKAVTDFTPSVSYDPESRPGVSNLVILHCLSDDMTPEEAVSTADCMSTAQYKRLVSDSLSQSLGPVRDNMRNLLKRPAYLIDILKYGASRARVRADVTYEHVKSLLGLNVIEADSILRLQNRQPLKAIISK